MIMKMTVVIFMMVMMSMVAIMMMEMMIFWVSLLERQFNVSSDQSIVTEKVKHQSHVWRVQFFFIEYMHA